MRKKNRVCKCGKKYKEHPVENCNWKSKEVKKSKFKCPTCNGEMWMDYTSGMWGKDYYWKCSKKKKHNPNCPDKTRYFECDKHSRILCDECKEVAK